MYKKHTEHKKKLTDKNQRMDKIFRTRNLKQTNKKPETTLYSDKVDSKANLIKKRKERHNLLVKERIQPEEKMILTYMHQEQ